MHLGRFFRQRSRKISFDELSEKLDPRLLPPAAANGCCGSAKGHSPAPAGTGKMRRNRPFSGSRANRGVQPQFGTFTPGTFARKTEPSFLGHPRKPQALDKGGLEQGADLGHPVIPSGVQAGDAGKPILAAQPAGFREFGSRALSLTV